MGVISSVAEATIKMKQASRGLWGGKTAMDYSQFEIFRDITDREVEA